MFLQHFLWSLISSRKTNFGVFNRTLHLQSFYRGSSKLEPSQFCIQYFQNFYIQFTQHTLIKCLLLFGFCNLPEEFLRSALALGFSGLRFAPSAFVGELIRQMALLLPSSLRSIPRLSTRGCQLDNTESQPFPKWSSILKKNLCQMVKLTCF